MLSEPLEDDLSDDPGPVLWIGPTKGPEFGPCFEQLAEERAVEVINELATVADMENGEEPFDMAVLACPRPLVSAAAAQPLIELAGTDSVIQLLGTWCEGEGRTGITLDGVERVFWHQWPTWWRLKNIAVEEQDAEAVGSVWVRSADAELARSLVTTLAAEGWGAVWAPSECADAPRAEVRNAAAIVWDGSQLGGSEAARLAAACAEARAEKTPVVTLLDFPRPETVATATALGAAVVLGKPFTSEAMFDVLRQAITEAKRNESTPLVELNSPEQACSGLLGDSATESDMPLHEAA